MNAMNNHSKQIDNYLTGEMGPDEIKSFELELKLNAQLSREFNLSVEIDQMIAEDEDVLSFRNQLKEIHERKSSTLTRTFSLTEFNRRWYYAAASIVALIMISGLLYLVVPKDYSNERLFSMYYSTEKVMNVSRSADNHLFEALIKYQHREFSEAARLFEAILREDENNIVIRFYSGIAYIETQHYSDAIAAFKKILEGEDNLYTEHASWFLGLTYLRVNETEEAINTFNSIMNDPNNYYFAQAQEIHNKVTKRN
jgi:tetratricopeptide (TPR) repeat protein